MANGAHFAVGQNLRNGVFGCGALLAVIARSSAGALRPGTAVPPAAVIRFFFLPARLWDGYSFYRPAFGTVTVSYTCDLHCGPSQNLKSKTNCKEIKTIPFETLKSHGVQCPGKSCVLAPCCPPFHRIPIAPTNFQAQISYCRISRFRSENNTASVNPCALPEKSCELAT